MRQLARPARALNSFGGDWRGCWDPRLEQGEHDGDQRRSDEQAQKAKCDEAAEDAQDRQRQRHAYAKTDEQGLDEIVERADE